MSSYAVKDADTIIRGESIFLSHVMVVESRKRKAVKHFLPVTVDSYLIAGRRKANHSFGQSKSLIFSENQLAFDRLNHADSII